MRVHDSQANRTMAVTRERISCLLELREILLSFKTGFNLVNAAVVCTIMESMSGLEPSSVITEPRFLELLTVSLCTVRHGFYLRRQTHTTSEVVCLRTKQKHTKGRHILHTAREGGDQQRPF